MNIDAQLIALRELKDRLAAHERSLRDDAFASLQPGDRRTVWVDGVQVGAVARSKTGKPKIVAVVDDREAFVAWAENFAPGEVQTVKSVRPGSEATILASFAKGELVDRGTGEVLSGVPGVKLVESAGTASTVRVTPESTPEARGVLDGFGDAVMTALGIEPRRIEQQ